MGTENQTSNMLEPEQLDDIDREILSVLENGRVTPEYTRRVLLDQYETDVTSQYIGQRLKRLCEHGHVQNPYDVAGFYELVNDPRQKK